MNNEIARAIVEKNKKTFEEIAPHFSATRSHLWNELLYFKQFIKSSNRSLNALDLGCGNGRAIELFSNVPTIYTGIDSSAPLIQEARNKYTNCDFRIDDILRTNLLTSSTYDYILSIASLHHIPPPLHRGLLQKIYRALAPNGYFFLTAWNLYHLKFLKFFLDTLQGHISNNETAYGFPYRALGYRDLFIPWKSPRMRPAFAGRRVASCECGISDNVTPNEVTNTIQLNWRYYHAFTKQSLRALLYDAGFTSIVFSPNDKRNFIIVARK